MRSVIILWIVIAGHTCLANMASPIRRGTCSSSAFSSRDIDILRERIRLSIDKGFGTASYQIEYLIRNDREGKQIPLLFYARDFQGNFRVWIDGKETTLLDFPVDGFEFPGDAGARDSFSRFTGPPGSGGARLNRENFTVHFERSTEYCDPNDLKYFEVDLTQGEHTIRVEYDGFAWTDVSGWVKKYSFEYSLSPARSWRSFGTLEIALDAGSFSALVTTNLGEPVDGKDGPLTTWKFSKLPADFITVTYQPPLSAWSNMLIRMHPLGFMFFFALVLTGLHIFGLRKLRERNPAASTTWLVIAGSFIIPFIILLSFMLSFELIDQSIGPDAGGYHGYPFLVFIFYPLLAPLYGVVMWWINRRIARNSPE